MINTPDMTSYVVKIELYTRYVVMWGTCCCPTLIPVCSLFHPGTVSLAYRACLDRVKGRVTSLVVHPHGYVTHPDYGVV